MNKFKTNYSDFLFERKKVSHDEKYPKYDCIMTFVDIDNKEWEDDYLSIIDKNDIYDNDDNEYGLEKTPHATIIYGLHSDDITSEEKEKMFKIFKDLYEFEIETDEINHFSKKDSPYDVVKFDVNSPKLEELRSFFINLFPNTQTFKGYHPHITLSYVKKGTGHKYDKKLDKKIKFKINKIVYSDYIFKKKNFTLKKLKDESK